MILRDQTATVGPTGTYARQVGIRLRRIRGQKGLSLQDVELASAQEFKASVLGAYERGERVISVPRLQRLARLYSVPVEQLLPQEGGAGAGTVPRPSGGPEGRPEGHEEPSAIGDLKLTFDLVALEGVDDNQLGMVRRYIESVQVMRQDFNGRMLTIRGDDIRAIAGMLGLEPGALVARLEKYRLPRP